MRYQMREGMVAWLLHRITGVGVVLFLLLHVLDITLIGWGPKTFNALLFFYRAVPFRVLEVFLLAGVLYHALNGIRIILVDFSRRGNAHQKVLFYGEMVVFTGLFVPALYLMFR